MAFKKQLKRYVKRQAKRGIAAAKKRYVKKGGPNVKNIYKDVMMLKSLVNVEKKRYDMTTPNAITFGQTNGAGLSGHYCAAISPTPAQGITGNTRNGLSIKLVSGCLDMYFNQSVNTINGLRIRYTLVCKPDNGIDIVPQNAFDSFYEVNPFSGVRDFHAPRDAENFNSYKIIKTGTVSLMPDSLTGAISYKQLRIPLKFNHHLKFQTDGTTTTSKNKMFIFFQMDTGDATALTGGQLQYNMRWYYTDN